jgi:hypothetical protein
MTARRRPAAACGHDIQSLDSVGALVDLRDAGVAHELLHPPFGDVSVAADTAVPDRVVEAEIREDAFSTGVIRPMWSSAVWRSLSSCERWAMSDCSAVHSTSARAASLKALMAMRLRRTSGWTMIGSAGLSGLFAR